MSHPSPTGNGCTLEDCHTNLFALTDLSGIKWRKLTAESVPVVEPLDDPVLVSFAKCIQSDILCVWRRVQKHAELPNLDHLPFSKELWIFWYGEKPANLDDILSPELREVESGSWDHGLSYECRTLLFKALHQLIERCLLSRNFIRLGKWFVQPYDQLQPESDKSAHLSFSFNYFLHGESTVCASIEVKQHPPVWRLAPHHLTLAHSNQASVQVILAPYGLNGILTGQRPLESDQHGRKLLEDWKIFYSLDSGEPEASADSNRLPSLVEVVVAGVRMKYPSCFVFVCEAEESPARMQAVMPVTGASQGQPRPHTLSSQMNSIPLTPPTSPADPSLLGMTDTSVKVVPTSTLCTGARLESGQNPHTINTISQRIVEKVCQDCCITAGTAKRTTDASSEELAGTWELAEPTSRCNCSCSRHKATKNKSGGMSTGKGGSGAGSKHAKGDKGDKSDRSSGRPNRSMTPFHRRSPVTDDLLQFDMDMIMARMPPNPAFRGSQPAGPPTASTPTPTALPQLPRNPSMEASVESPSPAPSPLDDQHNPSMVSQTMEPTMPTLSPHPPTKHAGDKEQRAEKTHTVPTASVENGSVFNGTLEVLGKPVDSTPGSARPEPSVVSPCNGAPHVDLKQESVNSWLHSQRQLHVDIHGIKRPSLPETDLSNQDEISTESFYDFKSLNSWFEYPIKKAKLDAKGELKPVCHLQLQNSLNHHQKQQSKTPSPIPKNDPYEFQDDCYMAPGGFSRYRTSRDDSIPRPSPFGRSMDDDSRDSMHNDDRGSQMDLDSPSGQAGRPLGVFTREKDLQASFKDLDHMFDSDEDDNEDMNLPPTPASSNKPEETSIKCVKMTSISSNTMGTIGPSELARMFPTPPSLSETNPTHSPGTDLGMDIVEAICTKVEPFTGTAIDTASKDWSYVFKPPKYCQFLGSNRYAPVELPSGALSPVQSPPEYKASWQYAIPIMEKPPPPPSTYINIPSVETVPNLSRLHPGAEASPATFHGSIQQRTPRTPMSYELQSPASNASSYMNRTLNSIDNQGTNHQISEAHSLVVNIILMDSLLNIYKDHNFDSCNICVCNMSIKGADFGLYLPNAGSEPQGHCQCAFSAIMNRKYGHSSGLFYEDEVDITGIRNDRFDRRKPPLRAVEFQPGEGGEHKAPTVPEEDVNPTITELLLSQFHISNPSCSVVHLFNKLRTDAATSYSGPSVDMLQMQDGNEAAYAALEQGRQAMEHCSPTKVEDAALKASTLHKWPYQVTQSAPVNPQNVVRLLKSLLPLLQDAIQKKRTTRLWEPTYEYSVTGPLSWKDFHKMAGRGNNESCEPQPIPSFLVGHDKEWMSISPFALKYWDKLLLEPYGKPRDVVYVVVSPDSDYVLTHVKRFFKELSTVYELSRLGKHSPMSKVLRDGIMRVGKKAQNLGKEQVEDWFHNIGDSAVAAKLRLYFLTCRYHLAPFLSQQTLDKHLLESTGSSQQKPPFQPHPEPSPKPPATPDNSAGASTPQHGGAGGEESKEGISSTYDTSHVRDSISHDTDSEDNGKCPALVVYLVDPFTYSQQWDHLSRLAMVGLLRCYESMLRYLPEHLQNNTFLQIVPLKMILDKQEPGAQMQHLKSMAFSVFTMCRWNLSHTIPGRSLTGMGPAAAADHFLKNKGGDKAGPLKLYAPPYVLAPLKDKQSQLAESCGEKLEKSNVIFCGYCLSEDQRWLLATFTDQRGEMTEMCTVNIEIPNRNRRRKASARKIGLAKLWDYILGVISMTTTPCRVVIGRFGRLGHGELKGWGGLLSKKNLVNASKHLREMCVQCSAQPLSSSDLPCILSACLVSMEPHPTFRVMPESVKVEEKMSSNCPLQTPRDASCTHILVFPTSTTAQANTQSNHQEPSMDLTLVLNEEEGGDCLFDDSELDFNTLFENVSPPASPHGQMQHTSSSPQGGSPTGRAHSPGKTNWSAMGGVGASSLNSQEEVCNLLLQPLAMGYYTSTAKTGPLPRWFWASCPEAENHCPAMFKSALHIHCPSVQQNPDELIDPSHSRNAHSLDSSETCDVLRFVLENYNALSWLNLDPSTNDRRSCLPIHFVNLMQIYHALNAFV